MEETQQGRRTNRTNGGFAPRRRADWLASLFEPLDAVPPSEPGPVAAGHAWTEPFAPRSLECFVDGDGEPGPYLRWLCVLRLVCERWQPGTTAWRSRADSVSAARPNQAELMQALLGALNRCDTRPALDAVPEGWLRGPFYVRQANLWPAERYRDASKSIHAALDQALREIRASDGLPGISLAQALAKPVLRPDEKINHEAMERFATWLESETDPPQEDLSRLRGEPYVEGDTGSERRRQLRELVTQLMPRTAADPSGIRPLLNVWSESNWTGLRALATQLCVRLKEELGATARGLRPALVYLPLDRLPASAENRRPTRRDVIGILHACLGLPAVAGHESHATPEARQLEEIQSALTSHRVLLILDGVELSAPPFGALFEVLRATDWAGLVRTLIQPDDEALVRNGGVYRSRVLVLSNRPLDDLRAWMHTPPEPLPHLHDEDDAIALLKNDTSISRLRDTLDDTCRRLWKSSAVRPRCEPHARSLHQLFPLSDEAVRAIVREARGMPSEFDLTLAWCADAAKYTWPAHGSARRWNPVGGDAWRALVLRTWLHDGEGPAGQSAASRWRSPGAAVALQFIALSVNGLRLTTLDRALRRFAESSTDAGLAESVQALRTLLARPSAGAGFAEHFHALIDRHGDSELEELPEGLRWFELQSDGRPPSALEAEQEKQLLDLRSEQMREWIVADLLSGERWRERFQLMNEVLAEEALAQATAQARRLPSRAVGDVLSVRRFIQAAFHGLMSLDLAQLDPRRRKVLLVPAPGSFHGSLPLDSYQRYLYCYEFIYRSCIENAPAWLLGRAFVREDVRLVILSILANPGWARHVLATIHTRSGKEREFTALGAFRDDPVPGYRVAFDVQQAHLQGALGRDLFRALLQSALRSGRQNAYAKLAQDIAGRLQRAGDARRDNGAGQRPSDTWWLGFAKIAIDALQGAAELERVEAICREQLEALNATVSVDSLLALGPALEASGWDKAGFEQARLRPLAEELCSGGASQRHLEHLSDMLFRLGELLATRSDWQDDRADLHASLVRYANAYGVFWIADRVRSNAATRDRSEINWPAVSARAMRYYVRVTLKVAKLLALQPPDEEGAAAGQPVDRALAFYHHARGRIDVYSRHLFRLPAERIQALLLLSAAARVRSSIALSADGGEAGHRLASACLGASYEYLGQARSLMTEHEYNRSVIKRYLLERIKTLARADRLGSPAAGQGLSAEHAMLARRDLQILTGLSAHSDYWRQIIGKLALSGAADPAA